MSDLFALTNPVVWLVTSRNKDERAGMIATWVSQATLSSIRPRVLVILSTESRTQRVIAETGRFALQLLDPTQQSLAERFALPWPGPGDRWEGLTHRTTASGLPLVQGGCGYLDCRVSDQMETGDRVVILGEILEEAVEDDRGPLREQDVLSRQPKNVRAALARSSEIDIERDNQLLHSAVRTSSPRVKS